MSYVTEIITNMSIDLDFIAKVYSNIPYPDLKLEVEIDAENQALFDEFEEYALKTSFVGLGITSLVFKQNATSKLRLENRDFDEFLDDVLFDLMESGII